jgi:hypothetical protein
MSIKKTDIIKLDLTDDIISEARRVTILKYPSIADTFIHRDLSAKYKSSLEGDMAKYAIKKWFEGNGLSVNDWDEDRTDNFRSSNKTYDLMVNSKTIEIRSSKSNDKDIDFILRKFSIIQPEYATVMDVTIQGYWISNNFSSLFLIAWAKKIDLEKREYIKQHQGKDFYMMPLSDANAKPINQLLTYL